MQFCSRSFGAKNRNFVESGCEACMGVWMKIFLLGQACNFLDEIYGGWQVGI